MFIREVKTENGWVRGIQAADPRITAYKGIPFAAPPVGENRWRAPQPCKDWEGVLDCFDFKPIAVQDVPPLDDKNVYTREWSVDPDLEMSEDCLHLNIWAPADPKNKNLPVFVWYFGGGLQVGHPSEMEFDGERLARRGIVVVSVNYRLNVFGFLCHPEITAEAPDAPANFGHLDQQCATRWVKRNIAAFGGDPENITIGGQSAGGMSVMAQLTSPQNEGLFQRAIVESGVNASAYPSPLRRRMGGNRLADAEKRGQAFFEALGVKTLEEARQVDFKTILAKTKEARGFWGTVADDRFCVGDTMNLFLQNKRLQVPVLWGRTSSEFYVKPFDETKEAFVEMVKENFGEDADELLTLVDAENSTIEQIREKASVPSIDLAIRAAGLVNAQGPKLPLYYYVFDAEIPGWDNAGTFHSVDLWFFFETLAKCWRPFVGKHYDLARQMCNYWAYFMKNGDPNGPDADGAEMPKWNAYTPENNACMVFGDVAKESSEKPGRLSELLIRRHLKQHGF